MHSRRATIIPLDEKNIEAALGILRCVFPRDKDYERALPRSLRSKGKRLVGYINEQGKKLTSLEYWVAEHDGEPVGVTGIYVMEEDQATAWLGWFAVKQTARKQKIGKQLLGFTIDEAQRRQFRTLKLWTSKSRAYHRAQRLFERSGFRVTEEETERDGRFKGIVLRKSL